MDEDIILPDGFTSETDQPQSDETVQDKVEEVANSETSPEITMENPKFKVKYNHEEKELSYDEAVPYIQKGMNYDKLNEKLESIQNDPRLSKAEKLSQASQLLGYPSDDELLEALFNLHYESTAQQRGTTPELEREKAEVERQKKQLEQEKEQQKTQQQLQEQKTKMYDRFVETFPQVKVEDIKPETWDKVKNGMDLTTAYIEQRNQELETKLKIIEQNEKNAKKALVSGATTHGSSQVASQDPFEMGFDSIK